MFFDVYQIQKLPSWQNNDIKNKFPVQFKHLTVHITNKFDKGFQILLIDSLASMFNSIYIENNLR